MQELLSKKLMVIVIFFYKCWWKNLSKVIHNIYIHPQPIIVGFF